MAEKKKHPGGRPTDYRPEYCQMVIDHMSQGLSFETFGAVINVHKSSLYLWQEKHPEFSDAVANAFNKCQLFWENLGVKHIISESVVGVGSKSLNANVWKFNMQNRFNWSDKKEVEQKTEISIDPNKQNLVVNMLEKFEKKK